MPGISDNVKALGTGFGAVKDCIASYFDVEYPLQQIGAPETGMMIKTSISKFALAEEKALKAVTDLHKFPLKADDFSKIVFAAENISNIHPDDLQRLTPAIEYVRKLFDDYRDMLHARAPQKFSAEGFPGTRIAANDAKIEAIKGALKNNTVTNQVLTLVGQMTGNSAILNADEKDALDKIIRKSHDAVTSKKITDMIKEISRLNAESAYLRDNNIKYVHIPLRIWFDDMMKERGNFQDILGRKALSIQAMVDAGYIKPEQVDIRDVMASYTRYVNRQIAFLDIADAARKEGMVRFPGEEGTEGYVSPPQKVKAFMPDEVVHPVFAHSIEDFFHGNEEATVNKVLSLFKMAQFTNPVVLSVYGLYHNFSAGAVPLPKIFMDSFNNIKTCSPDYQLAAYDGLFSKPFANPYSKFMEDLRATKDQHDAPKNIVMGALQRSMQYATKPHLALKDVYNASWTSAWMMEKSLRMVTYKSFMNSGMTSRDAAQLAAKFHSDYASIPPETRRALNRIFFTPSFEIGMTKLYLGMLEDAAKTAKAPFTNLGKKEPVTIDYKKTAQDNPGKVRNRRAMGLLMTAAMIFGLDGIMKKLNYKVDTNGRRYTQQVDTPEGKKTLVTVFANPSNVWLRWYEGLRPDEVPDNIFAKFGRFGVNRLNPLWAIAARIYSNKREDNTLVYNPYDGYKIPFEISSYFITRAIPFFKPFDEPETSKKEDTATDLAMKKVYGDVMAHVMKTFSYSYLRKSEAESEVAELKYLRESFEKYTKHMPTHDQAIEYQKNVENIIHNHQL